MWGWAPESVWNPLEQGPSLPLLRILPLPPPSPRKTRAPAPAILAGNPGLSNGGGGGGCGRNVTLGRWPRRTALLHRAQGWSTRRAGDSGEASRHGMGSLLLEGTRPCRQQCWQVGHLWGLGREKEPSTATMGMGSPRRGEEMLLGMGES